MTSERASSDRSRTLYRPEYERDACGVGFVASVAGRPSHAILAQAIESVVHLTHRGAVAADARTGDGAGVLTQIPRRLMLREAAALGVHVGDHTPIAVAMVFFPGRDAAATARARRELETTVDAEGMRRIGWRPVPVDPTVLGERALATQPRIEQLLVLPHPSWRVEEFERRCYLARKEFERRALALGLSEVYIPSFSCRTIVYKGMFVAPQLAAFYEDLRDPAFETALALFHQRYSTNTFPNWYLAQPFRMLAHNGEINTLDGNRNWMAAREATLADSIWGERAASLRPVITPGGSDSCSLDNAAELLVRSGRDPLHTMLMLVPEAWENMPHMDEDVRAFYEYHACLQEPWDGPAALAFTDGVVVGAVLDRNGLRPARYKLTRDILIVASEVGTIPIDDGEVVEKGRLGPGAMIAVDTARGVVLKNDEIKRTYAARQPYREWLAENLTRLSSAAPYHEETNGDSDTGPQNGHAPLDAPTLVQRQQACGYTNEDVRFVVRPMGADGKEPVWSMGDDAPLAVLSLHRRPIYAYFRQRFAQVTNPPIDPLREQLVMALDTYIGRRGNLLTETPEHARLLHLSSPMLLEGDLRTLRQIGASTPPFACAELDATFPVEQGPHGLDSALADLCVAAELAVDAGRSVLIISDRNISACRAPIPMPLAVGAVHHHLIRAGKRTLADIVAEAGDAWDIHHFAVLIGYGAAAVHPYLALETVRSFAGERGLEQMSAEELEGRYREAVNLGLLKIMSKMGISAIASYRGAQIFEILGLDERVVERCFAGTSSPIGGIGLRELAEDVLARHREAFPPPPELRLRDLGLIRYRSEGEYHLFNRPLVKAMQVAANGDRHAYRHMVHLDQERPPAALRDLLDFVPRQPIPLSEVEPVESIRRRFISTAMSLGALSPEAYTTLAIAMNMMGARSNSGEGGEDPTWYYEGDPLRVRHSKIKQVASGRFGVTAEYLAHAEEIEIKMAQGSKPGEGGQLPGHKVTELIARLRHAVPGIPLISPPPHHDIYSIEDLAQLIYDLKRVNPRARVGVKLVATVGVGTIAAGVAKAYADYVLISGHSGGTGASPLSSIKHAGCPWELGLAETQQVLVMNDLRGRIVVRTDGALKTGRDIVIAALLGAEEYGFGTAALIAMGCDMARQCHLNTCPTGIATQRPELRARFDGKPEQVVNYFTHVAEEVREILAQLGLRSLDEAIGRVDLLRQVEREGYERANALDLSRLLAEPSGGEGRPRRCLVARNQREDKPLDEVILRDVAAALDHGTPVFARYAIANHQRTVGATVAGEIGKRYGLRGLPEGTITCEFHGTAGQSFGAFLAPGMRWILIGEANDYVGKGMCGGEIVIRPPDHAAFAPHQNVIIGNTVLYGATGGYLFVNGRAGERFAVRNSGAQAVIEGVGDHGCEYMTGGVVVVLGPTGRNFGAGMSAGVAFVLDEERLLEQRYNREMVALERVEDPEDLALLRRLIQRHHELTGSARAARVLEHWERMLPLFRKVMPHPLREWRKKQLAAEQGQQAGATASGAADPVTRARV